VFFVIETFTKCFQIYYGFWHTFIKKVTCVLILLGACIRMLLILILNNHNDYECSNLFNLDQKKSCTFDFNIGFNEK
jgi:hypothetical protein